MQEQRISLTAVTSLLLECGIWYGKRDCTLFSYNEKIFWLYTFQHCTGF